MPCPASAPPVAMSRQLGRSIAQELRDGGVDGCLLVATRYLQSLRRNDRQRNRACRHPVGMISAIYDLALTTGANRVIRGAHRARMWRPTPGA